MVRQALFNILGARVPGMRVVDLYAGAGTVGFEALSRGAAHVTFVERDPEVTRLISDTVDRFRCADRVGVVTADALNWLRRNPLDGVDLCFLDAPYHDDGGVAALEAVAARTPALVVCQHHRSRAVGERIGSMARMRQVTHGITTLSFYEGD